MKNFILGMLTIVVIVGVGFFAYQYGKQEKPKENINPGISPIINISPTEALVGNDRDEHGCIASAGYEWCATKNKCLRSWEETCVAASNNDNNLIKQALVNKHNWKAEDILVTVSKNDGKYASGGVREKSSEVGGGYFFAVSDNGVWKIVADGNGTIDCKELAAYPDYPNTMIPECFDMTTGKSVKR